MSYVLLKTSFFGLHFCYRQLAGKSTEFSRITRNDGDYAVNGHRFRYQSKTHIWLTINDCLIPTYISSFTGSKFQVIA